MATREISVRELRSLNAADLRMLRTDDDLIITNRGEPLARIEPIAARSRARRLLDAVEGLTPIDVGTVDVIVEGRSASIEAQTE